MSEEKNEIEKNISKKFSQELADFICDKVSTHTMGIRKLCKLFPEMPRPETIRTWRLKNESFHAQYARAKIIQADILAEDCLDIADDDSGDNLITENGKKVANVEFMSRSRLRIDTRKWLASKLVPKIYGERIQLEQKNEENDALKEELLALRKKLDDENKKDY